MTRILLGVLLLLAGCAADGVRTAGRPSDHFHWRPGAAATGWVVALPGSSGLVVLDDDHHYFDVAARLNARGWNVLLVDYKPAYRASPDAPDGTTAEKIAWTAERAVAWMRDAHPETRDQPGAIVAWSLGGEGALRLAADAVRVEALGVRAVGLYYPAHEETTTLDNRVPLLVMVGDDDDVTPAAGIRRLVDARAADAAEVELHVYPHAGHGFDVASLVERRTIRLLPLIGPKATLQYDADAAEDAEARLANFLDRARSP